MAEIRVARVNQGQTKIKNVPIAVTPEGFWCCPSPVGFQKSQKSQNPLNKTKPSSPSPSPSPLPPPPQKANSTQKKPIIPPNERRTPSTPSRLVLSNNDQNQNASSEKPPPLAATPMASDRSGRPKIENLPRKVAIEFGEAGTCDVKVVLFGKQGFCVKLSVHKDVLTDKSSFFAQKLSEQSALSSSLQIDDCEDVEVYVETVGLMYCKEMKQRLMKLSVPRILRILKVLLNLIKDNVCAFVK